MRDKCGFPANAVAPSTAVGTLRDLALRVSGGLHGDAVLDLNGGTTVTLSHVWAQHVEGRVQQWFKVV